MKSLSRPAAFWSLGATLAAFLFASSAPSPLYVVYQAQWGFSTTALTGVFAVYAVALLAALLVAGSISDHIGRRPALLGALAVEIVAMLAFALADGVGWLFAARVLQGAATGVAIGCISAALLDLQPRDKQWLGALVGAAAPMVGLAGGAFAAGALVQWTDAATGAIFVAMMGVFALAVVVSLLLPETVERNPGWRSALTPRVGVPAHVRGPFLAALPTMTAVWALGGLVLALAPSLTAGVLGAESHVTGALPIVAMAGLSAVASVVIRRIPPRTTARGGLSFLIAGVAVVLGALQAESLALFLAGAALAGLGFGPAFAGVFRTLTEMAPPDRRAELASSVFTASYLAFSAPALVAGVAATEVGLRETAEVYGGVLIVVALVALALTSRLDPAAEPVAA